MELLFKATRSVCLRLEAVKVCFTHAHSTDARQQPLQLSIDYGNLIYILLIFVVPCADLQGILTCPVPIVRR